MEEWLDDEGKKGDGHFQLQLAYQDASTHWKLPFERRLQEPSLVVLLDDQAAGKSWSVLQLGTAKSEGKQALKTPLFVN